eukprot:2451048-Pyramimonas_sp.AAC.1
MTAPNESPEEPEGGHRLALEGPEVRQSMNNPEEKQCFRPSRIFASCRLGRRQDSLRVAPERNKSRLTEVKGWTKKCQNN